MSKDPTPDAMTEPNKQLVEAVAKKLCGIYDTQEREDGRLGGALVAYNAGVGMTIKFWNKMALAAIQATDGECQKLRSANARLVHTLMRCRHLPQKGSVLADEIDAALKEQSA